MGTAIRKHMRDFVALAVLLVLGVGTAWVILQNQRLRVPVLQERPFELKAEFETAQAVVAGQGQTIRVAGVKIGDVGSVELDGGLGTVEFAVDRDYLPIYRDATILMRPTTGLKDMFFHLDPGNPEAGEIEEGETLPVSNTAPDLDLDEILEGFDGDTQAYLRLLLVGAGKGLKGRDRELGELLGSLGPINLDFAQLNREVDRRNEELARLITNLNRLTTRVGEAEDDLTRFVEAQDDALGAIAEQDPNVQRAVRLLPGTLAQAERALNATASFAEVLGPAFNELRPFARNLEPLNASQARLARRITPVLEDEIRPFVRAALRPMPDLRTAARRFADTTPELTTVARKINRLGNLAAHNPNGAQPAGAPGRDEGYLYWVGWSGQTASNVFSAADGHGSYRRIYLTMGCEQANNIISDLDPMVQQFRQLITGITDPVLERVCSG